MLSETRFANTAELKRRLGITIFTVGNYCRANMVYDGSSHCRRTTRLEMAVEENAVVYEFDYGYFIWEALEKLLARRVELASLLRSRTLFKIIAKNRSTAKGRLYIDVWALEESYEREKL